jgi:DNA polymerase-3 subunit epsilon
VQSLSELGVLIVDCQTTGATPSQGEVLELGWCIARADLPDVEQLQAHWVTLPPKHFVPFQVRKLTGFDETSAVNALTPREAWERLRMTMRLAETSAFNSRPPDIDASAAVRVSDTEASVAVRLSDTRASAASLALTAPRIPSAIHFAKFELPFLRDWAERFEQGAPFPLDAVCVHAIACRLYPDLPRRSLRALAGFLGYGVDHARRSLGHVMATAFIWRKLAAELRAQSIHTWDELGDWLYAPPKPHRRKRRYPLPSARYRALPDRPGVYRFIRSNGDLLYVGKATSLRKRVASHFTAGSSTTERALEMLTQVNDIQVTPTHTALEAALLENEEIKTLRPPYNLQLVVDDPRTWFCTPKLDAVAAQPDAAFRHGPLPSTFSVRALGAIRALLSGETPTLTMRARAVEEAERWAPDEAVFSVGFARFAERHSLGAPLTDPRRALDTVARKLLLESKNTTPEVEESSDPRAWDPDRVLRHLERAVAHGYQLLQRARWLRLLRESVVVFHEPPSEHPRLLLVTSGKLNEPRDLLQGDDTPDAEYHPLAERALEFDRTEYDRLRTLTSELKRILRDGGTARVRVGRRRWLGDRALSALLSWV